MKNFLVFTKLEGLSHKVIKLKANEYTVTDGGSLIKFNDGVNTVAVFNLKELVGFIQEDHIVN